MAAVVASRAAVSHPGGASLLASRPPRPLTLSSRAAPVVHQRASLQVRSAFKSDEPDSKEKHFEFREDVGECKIADAKDALEACKGLEGQALEDCWASFNCNVDKVTDHYAKVAGVPVPGKEADKKKSE